MRTAGSRSFVVMFGLFVIGSLLFFLWPNFILWSAARNIDNLYADYRPFAYRWANAPYGRLQAQTQDKKRLESELTSLTIQVLKVKDRIPLNPRPVQLLGRINLLNSQVDPANLDNAISHYKLATLMDPNDPQLKLELGISLALQAQKNDQALQYEAALEQMLLALRHMSNPEAYFDSAILLAEFPMPIQAASQATIALSCERSPWRDETSALQTHLLETLQNHDQATHSFTSIPRAFLAMDTSDADHGIEIALHTAETVWLRPSDNPHALTETLQKLSSLLLSYRHDNWLRDILADPLRAEEGQAFSNLAEAIERNEKGEHSQAKALAVSAGEIFNRHHNVAGILRATVEEIYALDRLAQPDECLVRLKWLEPQATRHKYIWISAQAHLEQVSCTTRMRKADVITARKAAYEWVQKTGYEGLSLRAMGFMAEDYVAADSRLKMWQTGRKGVHEYWQSLVLPLRGYSFYYSLGFDARKAGDLEVAIALLKEATLLLKGAGINAIRALLLSDLAAWESEAGMADQAKQAVAEKDQEFATLDLAEGSGFRRESVLILVNELIASGHGAEALKQLEQITHGSAWPYKNLNEPVRRTLLPALGQAYLELNDLHSACINDLQIISEELEKLSSVHDQAQRDNALHQDDRAWRGFTEVQLRMGHAEEALYVWELYRSGWNKFSSLQPKTLPGCSGDTNSTHFIMHKGNAALVYAFLPGGLSGWLVNSSGVHHARIDAKRARIVSDHFARLAANPDSPIATVLKDSQDLYSLLLAPFDTSFPQQGTLDIDCESVLARIPWGALEDQTHHALIERFAISQFIGLPLLFGHTSDVSADFSHTLIFGSPALGDDLTKQYPVTPRMGKEANDLHDRLADSLLFQHDEATGEAFRTHIQQSTHFHFAGHGVSYGGFGALLVSAPKGTSNHFLTAEEISGLNLTHLHTVVLSACSTGIGEQAGIVNLDSLTGAFFAAGVKRVIAAGWDVDDAHTEILMSAFYDGLMYEQNPAEALRHAKLKVRFNAPHPYFWAGFQVYGQP
jgi:CHAT domain-containing protein